MLSSQTHRLSDISAMCRCKTPAVIYCTCSLLRQAMRGASNTSPQPPITQARFPLDAEESYQTIQGHVKYADIHSWPTTQAPQSAHTRYAGSSRASLPGCLTQAATLLLWTERRARESRLRDAVRGDCLRLDANG